MRKTNNSYHPDVQIFLVLIPFVSAFNYYLTYANIKFGWFLLLTFTIDTTQGYLAWWATRAFIFFLDKRWPYEIGGWKRLAVQLISTLAIGLFIISSTTELVSWIAKGKPAPVDFYLVDLFIIGIWFFVINGIYVGLYYYGKWRQSEEKREEENRIKVGGLMVKQGKRNLMINFDELVGLYVDDEYVAACNKDGLKFYLNESLDQVEKKLPASTFFRLNRQYIVHRQVVGGFKRGENGKIDVLTINPGVLPSAISVSRTKAAVFKNWFQPDAPDISR